jgi:hypothetical protein
MCLAVELSLEPFALPVCGEELRRADRLKRSEEVAFAA